MKDFSHRLKLKPKFVSYFQLILHSSIRAEIYQSDEGEKRKTDPIFGFIL